MYYFPKPLIFYKNVYTTSKQKVRVQSIHLQHLLCHNTIEFRNFAPTTDIKLLKNCVMISSKFIKEALKGNQGKPVNEWINDYEIPEWDVDINILKSWWKQATGGANHISHDSKKFNYMQSN